MKSIYFDLKIPQFLLTKFIGRVWKGVYFSPLSPVSFSNIKEIPLPGPEWVRVKNRLSGICASDLTIFFLKSSPTVSIAALPGKRRIFLGHEVCGEIIEAGSQAGSFKPGQRVVFQKNLPSCFDHEIEPKCHHCRAGNYSLCENQREGKAPDDVGGGWSEKLVAHHSQLVPLPDYISDEEAVLIEPTAVGMHAVLRRPPQPGEQILVVGAGIIGLLTLHILKQLESACRVSIIARHQFQIDQAEKFGADHIISPKDIYGEIADITNAKHFKGFFNNQMLIGGFDTIFDCVGNNDSIHHALRWCRAGGSVILVGLDVNPAKFDYTPLVFQETELVGCFCHGMENYKGEEISTFDLVIRFLQEKKLDLSGLITHRYRLKNFQQALTAVSQKTSSKIIKAVFEFV